MLHWKTDFDAGFFATIFSFLPLLLLNASPCSSSVFFSMRLLFKFLLWTPASSSLLLPYCQSSVDDDLTNVCLTSLALSALLSHELFPLSLDVELLKLLRNACEIGALSAICVGA